MEIYRDNQKRESVGRDAPARHNVVPCRSGGPRRPALQSPSLNCHR